MAGLKVRSRKDGAAVQLDDVDKKLLNLMQGSFPLAPRPYGHVATLAEVDEDEVMRRVQRLIDERIIRQVTPIFDTRVLGYSSMLVAARVDPEYPHRAAKIINSHPGVSHNYLRNHDFNMWFTIATEPDSKLGLQGTLNVLTDLTGAESVRQLPTLKLFKIRMDLEMEKGTKDLAAAGVAMDPMEPDPIELSELDYAVIRSLQGDMAVMPEPYAPAAKEIGISQAELLEHLESMHERKALRRVAAILFHRRAGFSANGMGVWNVPEKRVMEVAPLMASFRGISHCYQRPVYEDWPYSVFTMAHGRSKEECDAILDSIAEESGIEDRRTLYSSTEFKKVRLLYFTDAHKRWELNTPRSKDLFSEALELLPGGVNSPVRAMKAIGRDPIFVASGAGAELTDVDGNVYVDWQLSWGPLIAGHAHPDVIGAVTAAAARGTSFGAPTEAEVAIAREIAERVPGAEMVRMVNSGTEAAMSVIRLARAATGREKLLKFAGAYHGHVDGLLAEAGSGLATASLPASPGVPRGQAAATVIVPWNDRRAVKAALVNHSVAAILAEPYPANMGLVLPQEGFLEFLREQADANGALLVFDEVISGFRVARGGAQEREGVTPDLTILGKVIGGGLPAAAYSGPRELMERVAPAGDVYQAGTLSGNPLATAAGLATLELLDADAYARLEAVAAALATGLRELAAQVGIPLHLSHTTGLLTPFFHDGPVGGYDDAKRCDTVAHGAFCRAMLERGIYLPPSQFEAWFPSLAHTDVHVERTIAAARESLEEIAA